MITNFINEISKYTDFDYIDNKEIIEYVFCGDGQGDFEERKRDTTIECLNNYIDFCNDQIKLAQEYIELKEGQHNNG